jgi:hypothetical protein
LSDIEVHVALGMLKIFPQNMMPIKINQHDIQRLSYTTKQEIGAKS